MVVTCIAGSDGTPCLETSVAREDALSTSVLEAVSEESGTDVLELPPLESVVDTGALDGMFATYQTDWRIAFRYYGYDVVVEADRSLALYRDQ